MRPDHSCGRSRARTLTGVQVSAQCACTDQCPERTVSACARQMVASTSSAASGICAQLLPPPQMEESELHEVLHHTLANVDGKAYRTMMGQIFAQRVSPAIDYTYDSDILKVG